MGGRVWQMVYEYSKFSTSSLQVREYKVYMQVLHQNILSILLVYECENIKFKCKFSIKTFALHFSFTSARIKTFSLHFSFTSTKR